MAGELYNSNEEKSWAKLICTAWRSSITGILDTGQLLAESKLALEHGRFELMIANDLPFTPRTAQRLMAIASDERLTNTTHVSYLPPRYVYMFEKKLSERGSGDGLFEGCSA